VTAVAKPKPRVYLCAKCQRRLKRERWIYNQHTGARYCWPGDGCNK